MPCPRVAAGLWHACALSWTYEKKHKKKSHGERLLQSPMFSRKNYKKKFRKKNIKKERKKNLVKKHCSKIKTM